MIKAYDHKKIEKKWQNAWEKGGIYKVSDRIGGKKQYILDMFPYPSGEGLHVGHPKGYIATDIYSRFKKMSGFNILHPMGWDAFGLPAENFAIKNKTHPEKAVENNIKRYKKQLSIIGLNYDWSRELKTTDPKYYKWTQWIFLKLLEKGLAYQSYEPINWCPSCQTGLANEDLADGLCERCGSTVEKRPMRQWVLKITEYAEKLLDGLEPLNWPESIKESQRNWIGKSQGAEIDFLIENSDQKVTVFTTRPETIFGVTYLVLSPEHEFIAKNTGSISNIKEVLSFIEKTKNKTEIERTAEGKEKFGIELKRILAINPATKDKIPVWIADYVLPTYGTGAVMAVPAHDDRDFSFAKKYGLNLKQVIAPFFIDNEHLPKTDKKWSPRRNVQAIVKHPTEKKIIQIQWKEVPWRTFVIGGVEEGESYEDAVIREIREETGYRNIRKIEKLGWQMESHFFAEHKDVNRRAHTQVFVVELENLDRDELSGEEDSKHSVVWVPMSDFTKTFWPVSELSEIVANFEHGPHAFTGDGKLINSGKFSGSDSDKTKKDMVEFVGGRLVTRYKIQDWIFSRQRYWGEPIPVIHCEKCGVVPVPEKDLPVKLPKVKNYAPAGTGESPLAAIEKWVNVRCPKCKGAAKRETNTMPQWAGSCWYYLRYIDPKDSKKLVDPKKENHWSPVDVYVGGAEHATRHLIYARFWHKFLYDIGVVSRSEPFARLHNVGLILASDGRKMSKRYGNVINPDDIIETYGADTFRIYEMFMGPFDQSNSWDTKNIMGSRRFVERLWRLAGKVDKSDGSRSDTSNLQLLINETITKVENGIESFSFNTAVSSLMILSREFENQAKIPAKDFMVLLQLIAPFAPHVTEEIWQSLGNKTSIHQSAWPKWDPKIAGQKKTMIVVQVNGKVRDQFEAGMDLSENEIKTLALELDTVKKWLNGSQPRKIFFVKNRLINLVS